jgi:hypothetical protein
MKNFFRNNDYYQYDHPLTSQTTNHGSEGCTHENLRALIKLWHDKNVTQDQISKAVGYKPADEGLKPSHLVKAFQEFSLPYKVVFDAPVKSLLDAANSHGPVLIAVQYLLHPEMQGAVYAGHKATGSANGFARPLSKAGKDQLVGFTGGHSEILLAGRKRRDGITDIIVHDPNHHSSMRPKKVPYDRMTANQLKRMYDGFATINAARRTIAAIPLEVLTRG